MPCMSRAAVLAAALFSLPIMASSQPSYSCDGRLTRVEALICQDPQLGRLDVEMVRLYRVERRSVSGGAADKLINDQRIWRAWRDSCGAVTNCLRRRYEQRIIDFDPSRETRVYGGSRPPSSSQRGLQPQPTNTKTVVERRFRNGRYEVVYSDGSITFSSPGGSCFGSISPDGTQSQACASQVAGQTFPALPSVFDDWGDRMERDLLLVIDQLLPEVDRAPYRQSAQAKDYSERMLEHVYVINFLTQD